MAQRPKNLPQYVLIAESTLKDLFGVELFEIPGPIRNRLIVAACDAETAGPADEAEWRITDAVFDLFRQLRRKNCGAKQPRQG